jgi:hypothetical protein
MKRYHGHGDECTMCNRAFNDWYEVRVVDKKLSIPVDKKIVCYSCAVSREFWYLDDNNTLKYNEVKNNMSSSMTIYLDGE